MIFPNTGEEELNSEVAFYTLDSTTSKTFIWESGCLIYLSQKICGVIQSLVAPFNKKTQLSVYWLQ